MCCYGVEERATVVHHSSLELASAVVHVGLLGLVYSGWHKKERMNGIKKLNPPKRDWSSDLGQDTFTGFLVLFGFPITDSREKKSISFRNCLKLIKQASHLWITLALVNLYPGFTSKRESLNGKFVDENFACLCTARLLAWCDVDLDRSRNDLIVEIAHR